MKFSLTLFVCISTLLFNYTYAQNKDNKDSIDLEEIQVSSFRTNSRIELVPTRIEILGAEEMEEENGVKPGNIASLLGDIAGIQIQQVSAASGNTLARIQGLNGRYTQIMRDGIPLFGGLSGGFSILQIPPLDIQQIEIIRGSASTLYGGDAIGGIINIVSKDPGVKPQAILTLNASSLSEVNANSFVAIRNKKLGFTLFTGITRQQAIDTDHDGMSDVTQLEQYIVHPRLFYYPNAKTTVVLSYSGNFDKRMGGDMMRIKNLPANANYYLQTNLNRQQADLKSVYKYNHKNQLTVKVSGKYFRQNLNSTYYPLTATQTGMYSELSWSNKQDRCTWVGGFNFNSDNLGQQTSPNYQLNYSYLTEGAFLQLTYNANSKTIIEMGLRADHHTMGWFVLPRVAILHNYNAAWSSRVSVGQGYKTPTVISYVNPESDLNKIAGAPQLNPEKSLGINADVNYHKLFENKINLTLNQAFFFTQLNNPVFDSSSFSLLYLQNDVKALYTKGMHSYMRLRYLHSELYLSYVYTHISKSFDTQPNLMPVTPRHNVSMVVFYEPDEDFRVGIESSYIAGQVDQNYKAVKNYVLLAAMVQYTYKRFTWVLNGENLLDFRQNKYGRIYDNSAAAPSFHKLWAPIDGRVINLSMRVSLTEQP